MRRMKPEEYRGEAHRRLTNATHDLVARHGTWNAGKIKEEMERELRDGRLGRSGGMKL